MDRKARYRFLSTAGTAVLTAVVVFVAGDPTIQSVVTVLPPLERFPVDSLRGSSRLLRTATAVVVVLLLFVPLYKPRPRRILDTMMIAGRRVILATTTVATISYFDYTYRLPRLTVLIAFPLLMVVLPIWFVAIRRRPAGDESRVVVVGNDPEQIETIFEKSDIPITGFVTPPNTVSELTQADVAEPVTTVTDGSQIGQHGILGGFSQLEEILVEYDIDTAVLAFEQSDRQDFFGVLDICHRNGVTVRVHRNYADTLLTDEMGKGELVTVEIEPWDWQDRLIKRLFDIVFASTALLLLSPVIVVIAVAIKLEDGGPILYSQERTATFGDTFTIYKFRSMVEDAETETGAKISEEDAGGTDPRVTRVGRVLRRTHMDEIPQIWTILLGQMSVVGPRPERPELDADIREGVEDWHKRWFVKPGLTGLAQINNVTGNDPVEKLRHDIRYVQEQSFDTDVKIVVRQIVKVLIDIVTGLR